RGVGGIFFDYLQDDPEATFAFVRGCGDGFLDAYVPIAERRRGEPWGEREREWQLHRRGRYVEFNLLYDRGTVFGLKTFGRVESILMSLPPRVRWGYEVRAEPGSREAELLAALEKPRGWVEITCGCGAFRRRPPGSTSCFARAPTLPWADTRAHSRSSRIRTAPATPVRARLRGSAWRPAWTRPRAGARPALGWPPGSEPTPARTL